MSMATQPQLNGFEIAANYVSAKGEIGKIPASKVKPDGELLMGDGFKVELEYRVTNDGAGADKIDDYGNFEGEFARIIVARLVPASMKVLGFITNEQRDAVWRAGHGAAS
jgi:hypothetical protein